MIGLKRLYTEWQDKKHPAAKGRHRDKGVIHRADLSDWTVMAARPGVT
jgi:hypothetical protein